MTAPTPDPVLLRVLRCGPFALHGVPGGPHRADVGDLIHVAADAAARYVAEGWAEYYSD